MVVAAGALHGQAHDAAAHGGDHVVKIIHPELRIVLFAEAHFCVVAQEASGDQPVMRDIGKLVARQLFFQKLVVREILVEGLDDVIPIAPRIGAIEIMFVAVGVGIPRHVQPVPAPALAVLRRFKQPVKQLFPCVGRRVCDELAGLVDGRRQAREVQKRPA